MDRAVGAREGGVTREPAVRTSDVNAGRGVRTGYCVAGGLSFVESRQKEGRPCFCQDLNRRRRRGSAMGRDDVRSTFLAACAAPVPMVCVERPPARARLLELVAARRITEFRLVGGRLRALRCSGTLGVDRRPEGTTT